MKKLSLFILLAAVIGLTSCASLRIDKRHYSGGWYVDFGNNDKQKSSVANANEEEVVPAETTLADKENVTGTAPVFSDCSYCEQKTTTGTAGEVITITPSKEEAQTVTNSTAEQQQTPVTKHTKKNSVPSSEPADDRLILLVILAILIPPLAVYLKEGVTPMFWITLICWLIGGAFLFGRFGYGYIGGLGLLAIVLALLVVFDVI